MKDEFIKHPGDAFLRHYRDAGYNALPRGSLLDPALPMTFVGSAGLSQIETAIEQGKEHTGERYVLLQTCFRHFDIEQVGASIAHLSLFDMAGAFVFGEIQREPTLRHIWRFLIEEMQIDPRSFRATYFHGGTVDEHRFEADLETRDIWENLGFSPDQLIGVGVDAGFWKQGGGLSGRERFRKCGPTTELFVDRGKEFGCGEQCHPGCRCGRFVEIANILFIYAYIDEETLTLRPLATPFAETVIGVERVAMVAQRLETVFDLPPYAEAVAIMRRAASSASTPAEIEHGARIIADHLRALLFLVADGAPPPGKGGRARIMKVLIRGVLTHAKLLALPQPELLPHLLELFCAAQRHDFLNIQRARSLVVAYIRQEQRRFERTLSAGERYLRQLARNQENARISGWQAIECVKRHGIPLPLLEAKIAQMRMTLNPREYQEAYQSWKETIRGE
ncbi:alanyl-tRNA synthetase [Candidatus Moduliflexus flocculans]|uniref:alanine--tRNA ligase n=1 Tax=Candidatus Moduliflexus flocculans TaxID=1499966 RepID=A0A081BQ25_9BACT|nr:alanyl-tRNA synthetase [Candidatus Moduliflexus flocculans]